MPSFGPVGPRRQFRQQLPAQPPLFRPRAMSAPILGDWQPHPSTWHSQPPPVPGCQANEVYNAQSCNYVSSYIQAGHTGRQLSATVSRPPTAAAAGSASNHLTTPPNSPSKTHLQRKSPRLQAKVPPQRTSAADVSEVLHQANSTLNQPDATTSFLSGLGNLSGLSDMSADARVLVSPTTLTAQGRISQEMATCPPTSTAGPTQQFSSSQQSAVTTQQSPGSDQLNTPPAKPQADTQDRDTAGN